MEEGTTSDLLRNYEHHQRVHWNVRFPTPKRILAVLDPTSPNFDANQFLADIQIDELKARECLLLAKIDQIRSHNRHRRADPTFQIGDCVLLKTKHRKNEYKQKGEKRAAKFFPHYAGPYTVTDVHPQFSAYTLDLPAHLNIFPTFHADELKAYTDNDPSLFPNHEFPRPGPIITADGLAELRVDRILDEHKVGRGRRYLVRWRGYGSEFDSWEPGRSLQECEALDIWEGLVDG